MPSSSSSSSEAKRLTKRQENVFKKANELSILCGIEVCVIYYGPYGELKTWPEDREKVKDMARRYIELSEVKRRKKQVDLDMFLEMIIKDDDSKKKKVKLGSSYKYPDWDPRFYDYSEEQLKMLILSLERSQTIMQQRLRDVVESQRQRNMAGQEQMVTTTTSSAMNHLQQHSNQGSMDLFNPRISTLPQSQASTSASNKAYSLAPIPDSLTTHQDPNMEMYSRLLGSQETGMNDAFNTSMLPYNSFNTNCLNVFPNQFYQSCLKVDDPHGMNNMNVEDYCGLLWPQGSGMNGLQSMDMYGYYNSNNNINGYPHQFVQTPPVYQYMDRSTQNIRPLHEI